MVNRRKVDSVSSAGRRDRPSSLLLCSLIAVTLGFGPKVEGSAQEPPAVRGTDGTLVAQSPCDLHEVNYDEFVQDLEAFRLRALQAREDEFRALPSPTKADSLEFEGVREELLGLRPPPRESYERAFHSGRYRCLRIRYLSDGLQVAGYLFRPDDVSGGPLPVILFNRGGVGDFGALTDERMLTFLPFLERGYVVVASQYRGNGGGEGRDEFGGADVGDVLNLVPLVRGFDYADASKVFLWGHSRGGMMTYLALRRGIEVNAAVVGAGPTDLFAGLEMRPLMEEAYEEFIPDYRLRREAHLRERSALHWADALNVPLLILHGTADWRVDPEESLRLALRLQELGKDYELVMYHGDDHGLSANRDDVQARILDWFERHTGRTPDR